MMKKIAISLLTAVVAFAPAALKAEDAKPLTVLELFTSQGCSSCPPADAIVKVLRERSDVIALSWNVDYWDRLGWEDTMAMPGNAMRQAAYNRRLGVSGVYTPQIIVDGSMEGVGSYRKDIEAMIAKSQSMRQQYNVTPSITLEGSTLKVSLPEAPMPSEKTTNHNRGVDMDHVAVRVAFYRADVTVAVGDGENRGRDLHYSNVVRFTDIIGDWSGQPADYVADASTPMAEGADHVAILLQVGGKEGPIVGASSMRLAPASAVSR